MSGSVFIELKTRPEKAASLSLIILLAAAAWSSPSAGGLQEQAIAPLATAIDIAKAIIIVFILRLPAVVRIV
jgi:hypothetical protein